MSHVWRRWPAWNGQGCISLPHHEALFALRRGFIRMDGIRGEIVAIDELERDGSVALKVHFSNWTKPYPGTTSPDANRAERQEA